MRVAELLSSLFEQEAARIRKGPGPVKWCKRCSRHHGSHRGCGLVLVAVQAKSGRMVKRWAHPKP